METRILGESDGGTACSDVSFVCEADMNRRLYIAYGSNLSVDQMAFRCPEARIVGKAILRDWKLVFRTHADIEPCEGSEVPVLIWEINPLDERSLDRYEGYPFYYIKKDLEVTMSDTGETVTAMAYVMTRGRKASVPPAKHYYDVIAEGYDRFGFDKAVLEKALKEVSG